MGGAHSQQRKFQECLKPVLIATNYGKISEYLWNSHAVSNWDRVELYNMVKKYMPKIVFNDNSEFKSELECPIGKSLVLRGTAPNSVKILRQINEGSNGSIYLAEINGCAENIIKICNIGNTRKINEKLFANIFIEFLIMIMIECVKSDIISEVHERSGFSWPFPVVKFAAKGNYNEADVGLVVGMERLDVALDMLVMENLASFYDVIDILLQITVAMYWLQKTINFSHRDLHAGNIMIRKRRDAVFNRYAINPLVYVGRRSVFQAYIIDLGQSCVDFNECKKCGFPLVLNGEPTSYTDKTIKGCFNRSIDLKLLAGSLISVMRKSTDFMNELTEEQDEFVDNLESDVYSSVGGPDRDVKWHKIYNNSADDGTFTPEKFFNRLRTSPIGFIRL